MTTVTGRWNLGTWSFPDGCFRVVIWKWEQNMLWMLMGRVFVVAGLDVVVVVFVVPP